MKKMLIDFSTEERKQKVRDNRNNEKRSLELKKRFIKKSEGKKQTTEKRGSLRVNEPRQ